MCFRNSPVHRSVLHESSHISQDSPEQTGEVRAVRAKHDKIFQISDPQWTTEWEETKWVQPGSHSSLHCGDAHPLQCSQSVSWSHGCFTSWWVLMYFTVSCIIYREFPCIANIFGGKTNDARSSFVFVSWILASDCSQNIATKTKTYVQNEPLNTTKDCHFKIFFRHPGILHLQAWWVCVSSQLLTSWSCSTSPQTSWSTVLYHINSRQLCPKFVNFSVKDHPTGREGVSSSED